jgi:predicted dehydrogenase
MGGGRRKVKEKLRIAVAGLGGIGAHVARLARLNPRITLTACCDPLPERAERFSARFGIKMRYVEYRAMLDGGGFDAVYLAVPHDLHAPMIREAAEKGLAVFCEKPPANDLAGAAELVRLERAGAKIAINYQNRWEPGCFALIRAVGTGALGRLLYARCVVPWRRNRDYFEAAWGWHGLKARAGGGTLITQGSHFLDVIIAAAGGRAVRATGITANAVFDGIEVEDLAMGIVELSGGALVSVTSSMVTNPGRPPEIEAACEKGTVIWVGSPRPQGRSRVRIRAPGVKVRPERPPVPGVHPLSKSLEAFRRWIADGGPAPVTAEDAFRTQAAVDALYRSAASGRTETVEGI